MPRTSSWNPIAFVPAQVTIISSAVYIALFAVLLWVHTTVPVAPNDPTPIKGINLTQAWYDLETVSDGFHPYNSRRNDEVRHYLIERIGRMVGGNGASLGVVKGTQKTQESDLGQQDVVMFVDGKENVTFVDDWRHLPISCYTESENVLVYIRGQDDEPGAWWETDSPYHGLGGVLVNAHYDSVSTGYGATDDGVGVVTVLQLISYFTTKGHKPRRGIVALLNNGEEDGLYGAKAYLRHPLSRFARTFLNLEGAGAGGRATLFRSTDAEVTRFYASSPNPFGTVISADGFKRGFIASGTDYSVFTQDGGLRGLDVAFMEPRARYHTEQDDARDTNPDSLWHMLSSSLETMKAMTSYTGNSFEGGETKTGKLKGGSRSEGVWFDVLGHAFAVVRLHTLFALSVTLLVVAPVLLILLEMIIARQGKWYPFARKQYLHSSDDDEPVHISGFRGFFRFPIAFIVATAAVVALAFLQTKINPYVMYSSEFAVWAMLLGAWVSIMWFLLTMADRVRPTALSRLYVLIWIYVFSWVALVLATVGENNLKVSSGYFVLIYNAAVFVALLISYLELFGLPSKTKYVEHVAEAQGSHSPRTASISSRRMLDQNEERPRSSREGEADDEDAHERTSLLRGGERRNRNKGSGFARRRNQDVNGGLDENEDEYLAKAYGDEQAWSGSLPQWTWILQFLVLAPVNIILIGQIALLLTSALHQTPADGNPVLPVYLLMCAMTVLLLLPLTPFLHRFSFHLPTLFFFIFVGCLIYNMLAFPFSREARMKHYFAQTIDLDTGVNNVSLTGLDPYVQDIVHELPSFAGQQLDCTSPNEGKRKGLSTCSWHGLPPNVVSPSAFLAPYSYSNKTKYSDWLQYNISATPTSALFTFSGRNTKNCRLTFASPINSLQIEDAASDPRFDTVAENGSTEVKLFSREWEKVFRVNVTWPESESVKGQEGKVECNWSEANQKGVVPALDEVWRFQPVWAAVTKLQEGLVVGQKAWKI